MKTTWIVLSTVTVLGLAGLAWAVSNPTTTAGIDCCALELPCCPGPCCLSGE